MTPKAEPEARSDAEYRVAGVIPAAGASRRMGRPKGLLEIGGRTFARRVTEALAGGGCDPVYAVVEEGDDDLARPFRDAGARVLENADPGDGPVTSLRLALAEVDDGVECVAYLPLDHPLVEARHVADLIAAARRSGASLALPVHGSKRGHPALFGRALFDELLDPALQGGARTVVHRHLAEACLLVCEDAAVVTDIDTPEAYRAALQRHETVDASARGGR